MKLVIECPPWAYRILSHDYGKIVPCEDRIGYTLEDYFTDVLAEAAETLIIEQEDSTSSSSTSTDDDDKAKTRIAANTRIKRQILEAIGKLTE